MSEASEPANASPFTRRTAALLARGPFGRYAAGTVVSQTGTWMQSMAQSWVMTGLTTSDFTLSLVQAFTSLPMLALMMYGGTVADRFDKRKILVLTQVVQMVLAVVVGLLVMTHHIRIWHILAAAFLLGISASFEMPADSALVPELVDKENIANAIAVDRSIFHGTRLVGPAIAGQLIDLLGAASAFFANALSFVALIAALLSIAPRPAGNEEEETQRSSGMMAGVRYVRGDAPTMAMLGIMASNSMFIFPFMAVLVLPYARHDLGLNAGYASLLMTVSGVGSLLASIGMLRVPRPKRVPFMAMSTVAMTCALFAISAASGFWAAALAMTVLSAGGVAQLRPGEHHHPGARPRPDARAGVGAGDDGVGGGDALCLHGRVDGRGPHRHPAHGDGLRRRLRPGDALPVLRPRAPRHRTARHGGGGRAGGGVESRCGLRVAEAKPEGRRRDGSRVKGAFVG